LIRYGDLELPRAVMTRLVVALEDLGRIQGRPEPALARFSDPCL
jgi:hypothetical protein